MGTKSAWLVVAIIIVAFFTGAMLLSRGPDLSKDPRIKAFAEIRPQAAAWQTDETFTVVGIGVEPIVGTDCTRIVVVRKRDKEPFAALVFGKNVPEAGETVRLLALHYQPSYGMDQQVICVEVKNDNF